MAGSGSRIVTFRHEKQDTEASNLQSRRCSTVRALGRVHRNYLTFREPAAIDRVAR
jgi:hypothetical protein